MGRDNTLSEVLSILPESLISRIQQFGQNAKLQKWQLGDDVLEIYAYFVAHQMPKSLLDAAWVAHVLTGGEKAQNTLRQYALISQFYPLAVRIYLRYDELPYSHFVYASSVEGIHANGKPNYQVILETSREKMIENGGRPISEESLRLFFSTAKYPQSAGDFYEKTIQPPDIYRTPVLGRFGVHGGALGQRENALNRLAELVGEIKALLPALDDKPGLARVLGGLVLSATTYLEAKGSGLLADETIFNRTIDANNGL